MKCPKCNYLGFETGDRCRHCGYNFSLIPDESAHGDAELTLHDADASETSIELPLNTGLGTIAADAAVADADNFDLALRQGTQAEGAEDIAPVPRLQSNPVVDVPQQPTPAERAPVRSAHCAAPWIVARAAGNTCVNLLFTPGAMFPR